MYNIIINEKQIHTNEIMEVLKCIVTMILK
nr:MAG TPA: hypothetical protein [Caudoviricetes sp.]